MQDETLSQPLPLPPQRPRRTLAATLLVALLAFVVGGGIAGWLVASDRLPFALPGSLTGTPSAPSLPAARLTTQPIPVPTGIGSSPLGAVETRLALLEDRLSRIDGEANAASGNAARAEALLIAYATRRRMDKGEPLGFLEDQLRLRFGGSQPKAVETIISAAKKPVTLDELSGQLEAAAPALAGQITDESTWTRVRREIAGLFVVRRAPMTTATPATRVARARLMLASGKIDEAIVEVERMPGAEGAQAWLEAARRYQDAQRALEVVETAAMLDPRSLRDGAGNPVERQSPIAAPADTAPGAAASPVE